MNFRGEDKFLGQPPWQTSLLYLIWLLAGISLLTTLTLPYMGEEGVYTVTSQEMWYHREWLKPIFYGASYGRPPFYNWLIMPVANALGWPQVLVASRLISAMMTMLTSGLLFVLVYRVTQRNTLLALLSATIFLSGDVLFKRGWLAYADPTFGFFCFLACAGVWLAVEEARLWWLVLAVFGVVAAFLSKALTAYGFFFGAQLVLFWKHRQGGWLLNPSVLVLQAVALLFPVFWNIAVTEGAHGSGMLLDIWHQMAILDVRAYVVKLLSFPFVLWVQFLPVSLIVAGIVGWYWARGGRGPAEGIGSREHALFSMALGILLINALPYWIAPQMRIRYLLPLYPFIAMMLAYGVWVHREKALKLVTGVLMVSVIARFGLGFWGYPYYERQYRGDYRAVAQAMIDLAQGRPIYTDYTSAIGISVVANINALRMPEMPPVSGIRAEAKTGLFFTNHREVMRGRFLREIVVGRTSLYLFDLAERSGPPT